MCGIYFLEVWPPQPGYLEGVITCGCGLTSCSCPPPMHGPSSPCSESLLTQPKSQVPQVWAAPSGLATAGDWSQHSAMSSMSIPGSRASIPAGDGSSPQPRSVAASPTPGHLPYCKLPEEEHPVPPQCGLSLLPPWQDAHFLTSPSAPALSRRTSSTVGVSCHQRHQAPASAVQPGLQSN